MQAWVMCERREDDLCLHGVASVRRSRLTIKSHPKELSEKSLLLQLQDVYFQLLRPLLIAKGFSLC